MTFPTLLDNAKIQLVIHAYSICKNQEQIAKYIGVSPRTLRAWVRKYPELKEYRNIHKFNKPEGDIPGWSKHVFD